MNQKTDPIIRVRIAIGKPTINKKKPRPFSQAPTKPTIIGTQAITAKNGRTCFRNDNMELIIRRAGNAGNWGATGYSPPSAGGRSRDARSAARERGALCCHPGLEPVFGCSLGTRFPTIII
jgi:hypothetical protein